MLLRRLAARLHRASLVAAAGVVTATSAVAAPWSDPEVYPYTTTAPLTDFGRWTHELYAEITYIVLLIFALVTVLLAVTLFRFRDDGSEGNPEQVHGNIQMELGWTIMPIIIVLYLIVPTVQTIFKIADAAPDGVTAADGTFKETVEIKVTGKRWWWDFEYPAYGIRTGNQIAIPDDRPVSLRITSDTIIHSFWVPRLGGKRDAVPGRINRIWFNMEHDVPKGEPMHLRGECAEYCGEAHALMRFEVIALDGADFDKWVAEYQKGPAFADESVKTAGEAAFAAGGCVACHMVTGNEGAVGKIGPDLTFFGDRRYIGAGVHDMFGPHSLADNGVTGEGAATVLEAWIRTPNALKPGTAKLANGKPRIDGMVIPADTNQDGVLSTDEYSAEQMQALVTYLLSQQSSFPLRPAN